MDSLSVGLDARFPETSSGLVRGMTQLIICLYCHSRDMSRAFFGEAGIQCFSFAIHIN